MVKKKHSYYSDPRRVSRGLMPGEYSAKDLDLRGLLEDLEKRITSLEATITTAQKEAEDVGAQLGETGSSTSGYHLRAITALYSARRAFYGYAMLLESMGLSKDQKQVIQQLQNITNMVIRLQQTIQMVNIAINLMEAHAGPIGWAMIALSAGTLAGSMVYGSRGIGG